MTGACLDAPGPEALRLPAVPPSAAPAEPSVAGWGRAETITGRPSRSGQKKPAATTPCRALRRCCTSAGYGPAARAGPPAFGRIQTAVGSRGPKAHVTGAPPGL